MKMVDRFMETTERIQTLGVNDYCIYKNGIKTWFYYGSPIVQLTDEVVEVNWYGWTTSSTTRRIYGVLDALGIARPKKAGGFYGFKRKQDSETD